MPVVLFAAILSCPGANEVSWVRFNRDGDDLVVRIEEGDLGAPASVELRSTTGAVAVASAGVDPGAGPVGTEHRVTVDVAAEYVDEVGRVTVEIDSGDRGLELFELARDSAEAGHWERGLTSSGVEGEVREDVVSFLLWAEEETSADEGAP